MNNLHESGEDYLEAIYMLKQTNQFVRSVDVAKTLGYSKPSVSRAMKQLKENELIVIEEDGNIILTKIGNEYAIKIFERHQFFTDFLVYIGVEDETAKRDACRIEHVLSPASFKAMKEYIDQIRTCSCSANQNRLKH